MRRVMVAAFAAFLMMVTGLWSSPAMAGQSCDNGQSMASYQMGIHHGSQVFRPKINIFWQTGGGCLITGDYVWVRVKFYGADIETDPHITVIKIGTLRLTDETLGGVVDATCDNTPGGSGWPDGAGCQDWLVLDNIIQYTSFSQTEKFNCDRYGWVGETFGERVTIQVRWDNGDSGSFSHNALQWNAPTSKCT